LDKQDFNAAQYEDGRDTTVINVPIDVRGLLSDAIRTLP
jgi:hypothetical protein